MANICSCYSSREACGRQNIVSFATRLTAFSVSFRDLWGQRLLGGGQPVDLLVELREVAAELAWRQRPGPAERALSTVRLGLVTV